MKNYFGKAGLLLAVFLTISIFNGGCGSKSSDNPSPHLQKKWTYMAYIGVNNNLSSPGLTNLHEMQKVGSTENVNIVVQTRFSKQYTPSLPEDKTHALRFYVQKIAGSEVDLSQGVSIGDVNMAKPESLRDFIKWAVLNYPAENYLLDISDHGNGWKESRKGAVEDDSTSPYSWLSLADLSTAVSDSGTRLNVICYDACLMAQYEVAYQFLGLCDYMVVSEELVPGAGYPYDTILAELVANPGMTSRQLSELTVDKYYEFYNKPENKDNGTLSAVDMSKVGGLDQKIKDLAASLIQNPENSIILAAQDSTQYYSYTPYDYLMYRYYDIKNFCDYLADNLANPDSKAKAQAVSTYMASSSIITKNIYISTAKKSEDGSNGLSFFIPKKAQTSSSELDEYKTILCNIAENTWADFVRKYISEI